MRNKKSLIATGTMAMNSGIPALQNKAKAQINELATDLYKQYGPEVTKMADEKLREGSAAFVKMVNMGIKAGTNFEGSLEGAKTVNASEGYKLADMTGTGIPGGKLYTDRVPQEREGPAPGMSRVANIFATNPKDLATGLREQVTEGYEKFRPAPGESPADIERAKTYFGDLGSSMNPIQDYTISNEAEQAQQEMQDRAERARKVAGPILNVGVPGVGTLVNQGIKYADAQIQKLVDKYQGASMEERKTMEERYPNLIPRAQAMGITSYYDMDKYYSWADASGLRGVNETSRDSGGEVSYGSSGYGSGSSGSGGDSGSGSASGPRPQIYYEWDLGVNIPSPNDPLYTMYMTYLAERSAAAEELYS
jgi:hypothetical protein